MNIFQNYFFLQNIESLQVILLYFLNVKNTKTYIVSLYTILKVKVKLEGKE